MDYDGAKAKFAWYVTHSVRGDELTASEIYHDDALVEFPQSGERFRGKDNFIPWRSEYPATSIEFEVRSVRGAGDTWIVEGRVGYGDGNLIQFVDILEFRGELVSRETIYSIEAFPPDESRARYAEPSQLDTTPGLPLRIATGESTAESHT